MILRAFVPVKDSYATMRMCLNFSNYSKNLLAKYQLMVELKIQKTIRYRVSVLIGTSMKNVTFKSNFVFNLPGRERQSLTLHISCI